MSNFMKNKSYFRMFKKSNGYGKILNFEIPNVSSQRARQDKTRQDGQNLKMKSSHTEADTFLTHIVFVGKRFLQNSTDI